MDVTNATGKTTLEILSTFRGHKSVYVEDPENDKERDALAKKVDELKKDGFDLFLVEGDRVTRRIQGYDAKSHEWILFSRRVPAPAPADPESPENAQGGERRPAQDTTAKAVARTAGG